MLPLSSAKLVRLLVFLDKDDKLEAPSHNSLNIDNSVGLKEPTHYSIGVG